MIGYNGFAVRQRKNCKALRVCRLMFLKYVFSYLVQYGILDISPLILLLHRK